MGNKLITTALCCHPVDDVVLDLELEEVQDASFDFISVVQLPASNDADLKNKSNNNASVKAAHAGDLTPTDTLSPQSTSRLVSPSYFAANKIVAVVPIDLQDLESDNKRLASCFGAPKQQVKSNQEDQEVSFNEQLNMLKWDPESFETNATTKRLEEMYLFDEYVPPKHALISRLTSDVVDKKTTKKPSNWFKRFLGKCKKSTKKPSDEPYQLPIDDAEDNDQDLECCVPLHDDKEDDFSETESESDVSSNESEVDETLMPLSQVDESESILPTTTGDIQVNTYSLVRKSSSLASSLSCCSSCFSEDEDDDAFLPDLADSVADQKSGNLITLSTSQLRDTKQVNTSSLSSSSSSSSTSTRPMYVNDYLCECGECPFADEIYREVTNSSCWMNEQERQSLCRLLLAYATFNEKIGFRKEMIANAEECLLVFLGNEDDAFNALVLLNQAQYDPIASH